jgi:hypothetical protein
MDDECAVPDSPRAAVCDAIIARSGGGGGGGGGVGGRGVATTPTDGAVAGTGPWPVTNGNPPDVTETHGPEGVMAFRAKAGGVPEVTGSQVGITALMTDVFWPNPPTSAGASLQMEEGEGLDRAPPFAAEGVVASAAVGDVCRAVGGFT